MTTWNARCLGIEGRVDLECVVDEDHWREPPRTIRLPVIRPPRRVDHLAPLDIVNVDYEYEQRADDGTLIYRRVTPVFPPHPR